jgi:predicted nucleotidyltransferase
MNDKAAEANGWETIRAVAGRIAARFNPEKIILFGSWARGDAGPDSDADFLVVMPVNGSRRKLATAIELEVSSFGMPKDVIVVTPEEVERDRDEVGTVIKPALGEGKVLYERHA